MYEELVKSLRETQERIRSKPDVLMYVPPYQLTTAANAIEELSKRVQYFERKERWEREQRAPLH